MADEKVNVLDNVDVSDNSGGSLSPERLEAYHATLRREAATKLSQIIPEELAKSLGPAYASGKIKCKNLIADPVLGPLIDEAILSVRKNAIIISSKPDSIRSSVAALALAIRGYPIEPEHRSCVALAREKTVWTTGLCARLMDICEHDAIYTWQEIAEQLSAEFSIDLTTEAVKSAAGRLDVQKPTSLMDLHDRHQKLLQILAERPTISFYELAKQLGLIGKVTDATKYISEYLKDNKIQHRDNRPEWFRKRRLETSQWFSNNAEQLWKLWEYLSIQGVTQKDAAEMFNVTPAAISSVVQYHLSNAPTGKGIPRVLCSRDEVENHINEILAIIESEQ